MSRALLSNMFVLVAHYGNAAHSYVNLPFSSTPDQLEISGTYHGHNSGRQRHMLDITSCPGFLCCSDRFCRPHCRRPCCPLFWVV
ncbi:hypothetical protein F4604DRAFT_448344 [Suillus subluteus]|nr:hypothetical protein F4604DRAFT_448344 [Suillus subluteus]